MRGGASKEGIGGIFEKFGMVHDPNQSPAAFSPSPRLLARLEILPPPPSHAQVVIAWPCSSHGTCTQLLPYQLRPSHVATGLLSNGAVQ